jgi:Asp-tRNA(Asn)/Glu-tRNA(Gln) amidotransferase A subunit family amidase
MAKTVADVTVLFQAIATDVDAWSPGSSAPDFLTSWSRPHMDLRVGVPRAYFYDDLDLEVASAVEEALRVLGTFTREMREIELHPDADRTLQAAEAYSFHANSVAKTPELYQPETLRRIKTGENVARADYLRRRAELDTVRKEIRNVFETINVFVTPTTPIPAPSIAELKQNPDLLRPRELLLLRNTRPLNVWGLPAISVPCGFTKAGLPIGLQIAGPAGRDDLVLQLAYLYEQATTWHERTPVL